MNDNGQGNVRKLVPITTAVLSLMSLTLTLTWTEISDNDPAAMSYIVLLMPSPGLLSSVVGIALVVFAPAEQARNSHSTLLWLGFWLNAASLIGILIVRFLR